MREAVAEDDRRNKILEGAAELEDPGYISDHPCSPPSTTTFTSPPSPSKIETTTTASTLPPDLTGKARRLARKKLQSKINRQQSRIEDNAAAGYSHLDARPKTIKKYVLSANAVETPATMADAKVARTAYIGLNDKDIRDAHGYTLEDLVGEHSRFQFKLLKYRKGCVAIPSSLHFIRPPCTVEFRFLSSATTTRDTSSV